MAKGAYVGVNGAARKVKTEYVGVNGSARKIKKSYVGVNGTSRESYCDVILPQDFNATLTLLIKSQYGVQYPSWNFGCFAGSPGYSGYAVITPTATGQAGISLIELQIPEDVIIAAKRVYIYHDGTEFVFHKVAGLGLLNFNGPGPFSIDSRISFSLNVEI